MSNSSMIDSSPIRLLMLQLSRWLSTIVALLLITVFMAPRSTQAVAALLAVLPLVLLWPINGQLFKAERPTLVLGLMVFGLYIALNATLAVDRFEAFGKVLYFWVLLVMTYGASLVLARLDNEHLRSMARGALIGITIGAGLLLIESLFGQPLKKALFQALPATRLAPKHLKVDQGSVVQIAPYVLNRSLAVLCLTLWPALLMSRNLLPARWIAASAGLATVAAVAVFPSEHETSMLALVFSAAAFAGMRWAEPVMRRLILAGWLIATLLVVPIAMASYGAGLHQAKWIPETGRNRVILWGYTANEIRKAPLFGVGVASTKDLDEQASAKAARPSDHSYPLRTGRHSHNVFMQTWYELGLVGAILLAGVGVLILRTLASLSPIASAYAHAAFVSAVVIGAFSWGMWQTWFMAGYAIWALLLIISVEWHRRSAAT